MANYRYLTASLPSFPAEGPAPFSPDEFRFRCQGVLDAADLADLSAVLSRRPEEGKSAFCAAWAAVEAQIRNAVAKSRGAKLGVEAKPFLKSHRGYRVWIDKAVSDALAKPNPLACEIALDEVRRQAAEDLARECGGGLADVLAFAVRLRQANRWGAMTEAAGRAKLDALVDDLEKGAVESGATDFN